MQGQGSRLAINRVYLTGILAADPQKDRSRSGDSVTLLLVAFPAPDATDTQERWETASCEVEVPDDVVKKHDTQLQAGLPICVTGQLTGGGGVIATQVVSGQLPDQELPR
jgi:hypothetical protein